MVTINLAAADRESIQSATEALQDVGNDQLELLVQQLLQGNEGVIRRFAKGAYNHPITWWVGVFHLQMQKGMWGARYQASANMRGSILTQVLRPVRSELKRASGDEDTLLLSRAVKYNLKYKKADIAGRFTGGQFTNYASIAGRFGNTRLSANAKRVRTISNFGIASYGAAIKAIILGHRRINAILQAILTGRAENIPSGYMQDPLDFLDPDEDSLLHTLELIITEITQLSQFSSSPVSVNEFCARPENINLEELCK